MPDSTPRIELHCHLDGSVRLDTIAELAREQGIVFPAPVRELAVAPQHPVGLRSYIACIDVALMVLQTRVALRRAAFELVSSWHDDDVIYGEVRFAPQLHTRDGLSMAEVLDAVTEGLADGAAATGVRTGLLLCALRHRPPEENLDVARLATANLERVAGFDLAGDESRPAGEHLAAFRMVRDAGLPVTAHAGEAGGAENVREALDELGAVRIGHGVAAARDPELVTRLAREGVTVEVCPTSNVQTGAVPSIARHPAARLAAAGVPVAVSTDARTVSDTTLTRELDLLRTEAGWSVAAQDRAQRAAAAGAFVPDAVHAELLARLGDGGRPVRSSSRR